MNRMKFLKDIKFRRPSTTQMILAVAGILLTIGGYFFARGLVTCWTITPLAGRPPESCGTVTESLNGPNLTNSEGTPVPDIEELPPPITIPDSNLPPAWDGASRINILIIGLDYRDWVAGEGAPRSDTMIVLTVDPLAKTAGILSIPRDLWVNIPGFGYSRINTAYSSGEGAKLPGGGPELARKTVEQLLGVPIQYYAQVDFYTFVEFIDLIGGIEIYNDEELRLDPVGEGKDKIKLTCCGMRKLNGERALAYARFRKDKEGDIARANRQQKVILGIRNKVLSPENFPHLIGQAQQFYEKFSAGIRTNMPFDTAIRLGVLAKDIPVESIKNGVIDYSMVALAETTLGGEKASVMKPLPDKIRELRDQVFTSGGAVSPFAAQNDLTAMMREDGARVRVLNGSVAGGLENVTGNFLIAQGVQVTEAGPADGGYNSTVIVLYSPKLYTLKYFQSLFAVTDSARIWISPNPASTVDIEVRLGNDWANNNPMQ
ncbi:MAG TPA: LCP family protein [Anaerolineales bacterium]|jgi:LCP family protein required for cell wall assembly|nr:LCP family protein [Anaerolineales bacterium]